MKEHRLTGEGVAAYVRWLREEERSPGTIEKYLRDLRQFAAWLGKREVTKEGVIQWKKDLCTGGKEPATINGKLAALNSFLTFAGWPECRVKGLGLVPGGVPAAHGHGPGGGEGTAGPAHGNHLCHGHPGVGGEGYHAGSRSGGPGGDFFEGEDPRHSTAG